MIGEETSLALRLDQFSTCLFRVNISHGSVVIPVQTGIQCTRKASCCIFLDPRLRGDDVGGNMHGRGMENRDAIITVNRNKQTSNPKVPI